MGETLERAMARSRAPGLDHIRLVAAMAVVVSHAWPLALGQGATEPMTGLLGIKLGESAVLVFFFLSGLLIAESAYRTRDNKWKFLANRGLRIAPGLFVALIVTVLIAVFCGAHPSWGEAAIYVLRGITLVSLEHTLSGAFANAPYPEAVNGPLWTLFYEVFCYAVIAAVVWMGVRMQRIRWIVAGALILLLLLATDLVELPPGAVERRLSIFQSAGVRVPGRLAGVAVQALPSAARGLCNRGPCVDGGSLDRGSVAEDRPPAPWSCAGLCSARLRLHEWITETARGYFLRSLYLRLAGGSGYRIDLGADESERTCHPEHTGGDSRRSSELVDG